MKSNKDLEEMERVLLTAQQIHDSILLNTMQFSDLEFVVAVKMLHDACYSKRPTMLKQACEILSALTKKATG